jgi:hypothetical protein
MIDRLELRSIHVILFKYHLLNALQFIVKFFSMFTKRLFVNKTLLAITRIAFEWSLSSMSSDMTFEIAFSYILKLEIIKEFHIL